MKNFGEVKGITRAVLNMRGEEKGIIREAFKEGEPIIARRSGVEKNTSVIDTSTIDGENPVELLSFISQFERYLNKSKLCFLSTN